MKGFREKLPTVVTIGVVVILLVGSIVAILSSHNRNVTSDTVVVTQEPTTTIVATVCIDAGHGGSDTGAIYGTTTEKDDNLQLALRVQTYLESMHLNVIMTRSDDSSVGLNERCRIANTEGADLFVSLHRNSSEDTSANGVEVWVHNSQPPIDYALATNVLNALQAVGVQSNRGIGLGYRGDSSENYRVNKLTTMPSCLVETGFLSNDTDRTLYSTHLDAYAKAIADAIYQTLEGVANGLVDTSRGKAGQNWDGFAVQFSTQP